MHSLQQPPTAAVPVTVHAFDPITRAGISRQSGWRLIEDEREEDSDSVHVLVIERLDHEGLSRMRAVTTNHGTRVVLVVGELDENGLGTALCCGVRVVVLRHEATEERLSQAAVTAAQDRSDVPSQLLGRLLEVMRPLERESRGQTQPAPGGDLTHRESDVLRLLAEGLDTREIATKMAYSERTVKGIIHGITTRLNLRNRVHAVAYALRAGHI